MNSHPHSSRGRVVALSVLAALGLTFAGCANTGSSTVVDPPTPPGLPNTPAVEVPNPPGVR